MTKKLKVIPLGGLGEIGKNITVIEYEDNIIVVDCGMGFPEDELLGIDLVIPDVTYLEKNVEKIKGIVLTHGHEDHIGALPYVLKKINVPVYGTRLTLGLVEQKLEEHRIKDVVKTKVVNQGDTIKLGCFKVEFIRTTHSIADSVALAIYTPEGIVVHTGDFKIDHTPIEGEPIDLIRFAELGRKGVLLLMADSTNAERKGYTMSEKTVGATFDRIFSEAKNRIIVATFASNVHRVQQVINSAVKYGRKVAICGRSMLNMAKVAIELGYMSVPEGVLVEIDSIKKYPQEKTVIITTGSQGEPMSALTRMAVSEHKKVDIVPGDLVVISASPIPGNEKLISRVINELLKKGADVIYEDLAEIHVSGHACQEELKIIHRLVKPKFFMPVHGEYKHLRKHAELVSSLGMPSKDIFLMEIGRTLELTKDRAQITGFVQAGRVLVDGLGVGDVGNIVLRDRKHLSQDGLIVIVITIDGASGSVIAGPDIISRGFVYVRESEKLMDDIKNVAKKALNKTQGKKKSDWATKKGLIKEDLKEYLYEKTKRRPMILPIIMEV
ncbi:MAG: ribonuclease J [Clostridiales bacterium]|nr:ribonuclease J [Clostridiales bacterium]